MVYNLKEVGWNILSRTWQALPDSVKKSIRELGVSPERLGTEYGPLHRLPIVYGEFQTDIPVRRSITSPWMNYDRDTRPYHEPLATAVYIREIEAGDVVWDLGSRFGYETAIAATLNEHPERVHTFEMTESKIWKLQRLNRVDFGGALNVNHVVVGKQSQGSHQLCLDDYADRRGVPNLVTMDIETAEIPALLGMRNTVESAAPTLLIEWHGTAMDHEENCDDVESAVRLLRENYSSIYYCEEYRDPGAEWQILDVGIPRMNCQLLVTA